MSVSTLRRWVCVPMALRHLSHDSTINNPPRHHFPLPHPLPKTENFGNYDVVYPRRTTTTLRYVPPHVRKPEYADSGQPRTFTTPQHSPILKSAEEVGRIRNSCQLARFVLDSVLKKVKVGVTTDELDEYAHSLTILNGGYPSPLNYKGFPKSICTSVNNVACHGIPDSRPLQSTDILNIDVTVYLDGYHGDCSETVSLTDVDEPGTHLLTATKTALDAAIGICGPGVPFTRIGETIEEVAKSRGLRVVPCFTGHGIGAFFHEPPDIHHLSYPYPGTMRPGQTFTIEPVLSQGSQIIEVQEDGWTALTTDNSRTAQFEQTILITAHGSTILTQRD